jgi:hypothetical protein
VCRFVFVLLGFQKEVSMSIRLIPVVLFSVALVAVPVLFVPSLPLLLAYDGAADCKGAHVVQAPAEIPGVGPVPASYMENGRCVDNPEGHYGCGITGPHTYGCTIIINDEPV